MTDQHRCPLCTETYADRTELHVHLEVEHRKSEIVATLVELSGTVADTTLEDEPTVLNDERPAPSAD
ncbi:hypothetical protein [Natronorubrum sp. FCH18a]|uniref:hypothetical protein n=1 Tax=Natronorubrum sp. FCH18a TaxID=3447018 RepID=UPI003F514C83